MKTKVIKKVNVIDEIKKSAEKAAKKYLEEKQNKNEKNN